MTCNKCNKFIRLTDMKGDLVSPLHFSSKGARPDISSWSSVVYFTPHYCQFVGRFGGLSCSWTVLQMPVTMFQQRPRTETRIKQMLSFSCYQEKSKAIRASKDEFMFSSSSSIQQPLCQWHSYWGRWWARGLGVLGSPLPFPPVSQFDIPHFSVPCNERQLQYTLTEMSHSCKQSLIWLFLHLLGLSLWFSRTHECMIQL